MNERERERRERKRKRKKKKDMAFSVLRTKQKGAGGTEVEGYWGAIRTIGKMSQQYRGEVTVPKPGQGQQDSR
jgi:hypothetical protein